VTQFLFILACSTFLQTPTSIDRQKKANEVEVSYNDKQSDTATSSDARVQIIFKYDVSLRDKITFKANYVDEKINKEHDEDLLGAIIHTHSFNPNYDFYSKVSAFRDQSSGFDSMIKLGIGAIKHFSQLQGLDVRIGYQYRMDEYMDDSSEELNMVQISARYKTKPFEHVTFRCSVDNSHDFKMDFNQFDAKISLTSKLSENYSLRLSYEYFSANKLIKGMKTTSLNKTNIGVAYRF